MTKFRRVSPSIEFSPAKARTLLHLAAYYGHFYMALLPLGQTAADVNAKNSDGRTPLHYAAYFGNIVVLQILINHGADVYAKDGRGNTCLHFAVSQSNAGVVHFLLFNFYCSRHKKLVDERNANGLTAFQLAVWLEKFNEAELLVQLGADIDSKDRNGDTTLYYAALFGKHDAVQWLLERGADVNVDDDRHHKPFRIAVAENRFVVARLLLDQLLLANETKNQIMDEKDNMGDALLHWAVMEDNAACVQWLLEHGADVNIKNSVGNTPLHVAVARRSFDNVKLLLGSKADARARNNKLRSVLGFAVHARDSRVLGLFSA